MHDPTVNRPGADLRVLSDRELDAVAGASIMSILSDAVNQVVKSMGDALSSAARKG